MKAAPLLSRLAVTGLFALLVSCLTTAPTTYLERDPEALGRRTGRADALAGRSSDYERHLHELHPSADQDDFEDAYETAYDDAEDEIGDREDDRQSSHEYSTQQAYNSGRATGQDDRDRGLSRNPFRHDAAAIGSSSITHSWIEGYNRGWNGR